jgi:riboflavin biosynthesis pyrimidine reductase
MFNLDDRPIGGCSTAAGLKLTRFLYLLKYFDMSRTYTASRGWFSLIQAFYDSEIRFGQQENATLQVLLSASMNVPENHIFFQYPTLIATGDLGLRRAHESSLFKNMPHVRILSFGKEKVDLNFLVQHLFLHEQVRLLDISAGGKCASEMMHAKVVDELRLTTSGQLCGPLNLGGQLRPSLFPASLPYSFNDNPHLEYLAIRLLCKQHLFSRLQIIYRHH